MNWIGIMMIVFLVLFFGFIAQVLFWEQLRYWWFKKRGYRVEKTKYGTIVWDK